MCLTLLINDDSVAVDIEKYTMRITDKMTISELKDLKEQSKNTMHLVYGAEHYDEEEKYDPYFMSWHTIYRNMDIDANKKVKLESLFPKIKTYLDKHYKGAANFTGKTELKIVFGDDYYYTFGDEYDLDSKEDDYMCLYNDYGQTVSGRQFFKKDYKPELTKNYTFY